jgi:hypothetical protein
VYVCMYVFIYICMYVFIYICMCVCVYVCRYVPLVCVANWPFAESAW